MEEPDLDCDVLERLNDVGVCHTEEGVVVAALNGEGVEVDKGGQEFAGMTTGPKGQIELKCL